jgi:predicted transcriptional regulator
MTKVTMTLSDDAIEALNRTAKRLGKPKSEIVRQAILSYGQRPDELTPEERARRLAILEKIRATLPTRTQAEADAELREIRAVRRLGGRRTPVE